MGDDQGNQREGAGAEGAARSLGKLVSPAPVLSDSDRVTDLPAPSAAQLQAEREEVDLGVSTLLEKQRHGMIRGISKFLNFGLLPLMVVVAVRQLTLGLTSVWFWIQFAAILVAGLVSASNQMSVQTRGVFLTICAIITSTVSLFHFGPILGVAFAYVAAILFAALLLQARQAYIAAGALLLGMYFRTLAIAIEPDLFAPGEIQVSLAQWIRSAAMSTVGLLTLLYVFLKVQSNLCESLAHQIRLRLREKKFVEEREKMVRTAGSVQRLESLGRLAGGIAHDFNNSLVLIQCGLDALGDDLDAAEREELLGEVNEGVSRAAMTSRQLLSFAKRNVEEMGSCDPRRVAERISKDATRLLPANIKLELTLPESGVVPGVALSEAAVEQLILIALQNSHEALGEQAGTISLKLSQDDVTAGLRLEVSDDGPGLPPDILERVWEPFFTTKGERHTGLGLSTAWATVRRHGGDIGISSSPGATRVAMSFPAALQEDSAANEAPSMPPVSLKMNEMVVLILEDEAPIRTALRRILKTTGLQVEEAESVARARELMKDRQFSLLISDGVLPDGGAGAFIRDFSREQKAPVILCSGYLEEDLALEGVARGKCSFLPKPFTAEELSSLVRSVLSSRLEPG